MSTQTTAIMSVQSDGAVTDGAVTDDGAETTTFDSLDAGCIETILSHCSAISIARAGRLSHGCRNAQEQAAVAAAERLGWPLGKHEGEMAAWALRAVEMMAARARSIDGGAAHSLFVHDKTLYACGGHPHYPNAIAHLGQGNENGPELYTPAAVMMPEGVTSLDVRQVSAGGAHSALITATGECYTWGAGSGGRLGHVEKAKQRSAAPTRHDAPRHPSRVRIAPHPLPFGARCGLQLRCQ